MSAPVAAPGMRRSLGRAEVTLLGINAIVGAGIFALPDDLFRELGGASPLVFVVCALGLLPIAWCYAEAARDTERSGGPYVYVRRAFGPLPGYVVGWMCFVNSIFSFAAVARIAAAYLAQVLGDGATTKEPILRAIAVAVVLGFSALNALGARPGARVAAGFTIGKLLALFVLIAVAVPAVVPARLLIPPPHGPAGFAPAIFIALFAAQGFEVAPVPAGETRDAGRVMPFAIIVSLLGASFLYVLVQAVVVGAHAGLARPSDTPLAEVALAVAPRLGQIVVWGGVISTLGFVAGNAFGTPRYAFAMAEDGYLPRALTYVSRRRGAPLGAIVATGLCAAALTASFPGRALVGISNLAVAVQYLGTCLAIGRGALVGRGWRRGLRALAAGLGILVSIWILAQGDAVERRTAFGAVALGLVIGYFSRRASLSAAAAPGGDR